MTAYGFWMARSSFSLFLDTSHRGLLLRGELIIGAFLGIAALGATWKGGASLELQPYATRETPSGSFPEVLKKESR